MSWFRKAPAPEPEPEMTAADHLLAADIALKIARENYANACLVVSRWNAKHPEYSLIDGKIVRLITPNDPEWRAIKTRESQTHHAMRVAMEKRAQVIERYAPKESRHIAGELVQR